MGYASNVALAVIEKRNAEKIRKAGGDVWDKEITTKWTDRENVEHDATIFLAEWTKWYDDDPEYEACAVSKQLEEWEDADYEPFFLVRVGENSEGDIEERGDFRMNNLIYSVSYISVLGEPLSSYTKLP